LIAFHEHSETALPYPFDGPSRGALAKTSPEHLSRWATLRRDGITVMARRVPELVPQNHWCFRLTGSRKAVHIRSDGAAPKSRAPNLAKQAMTESCGASLVPPV